MSRKLRVALAAILLATFAGSASAAILGPSIGPAFGFSGGGFRILGP